MFNLVGKRYLFLIISLLIIVPGTISLIFKGLDIGIDFAGGSTLQFRPSQHITLTTTQLKDQLANLGLKDVSVNIGSDPNTPGNSVAWVLLNTQVDATVRTEIQNRLSNSTGDAQNRLKTLKLSNAKVFSADTSATFDTVQVTTNGKTSNATQITIVNKNAKADGAFVVADLQQVLADLPKTTDPNASPSASATATTGSVSPGITPTANGTSAVSNATPTTTADATPTAGTTPTVGATPTATATATATSAGTIPVSVSKTTVGNVTDTMNVLTSTTTEGSVVSKIKSDFLKQNIFLYTLNNSSVSGSVASDTIRNSVLAVLAASALILLYVWFAFRKVQKPWRYGASAIIALLHDVLVVLGVFSILGWTLHIQVDALFITALLTVVGFSVHDTIVVFDRIRENMQRRSSETFEQIVNASLIQTMSRSLNTSLTVLFTLSALTLFGGESIRVFTFTLLIGIFSGTYSSIFNASMILVIWEKGELGLWRFNRDNRGRDGRIRRPEAQRELARSRG